MLFAVGAGIPRNMLDGTAATGVETVILPPHAALPSPVASHADLLIHPLNGVLYTFGGYYRIAANITGLVGQDCIVSVTVADWETPVTQNVELGA